MIYRSHHNLRSGRVVQQEVKQDDLLLPSIQSQPLLPTAKNQNMSKYTPYLVSLP